MSSWNNSAYCVAVSPGELQPWIHTPATPASYTTLTGTPTAQKLLDGEPSIPNPTDSRKDSKRCLTFLTLVIGTCAIIATVVTAVVLVLSPKSESSISIQTSVVTRNASLPYVNTSISHTSGMLSVSVPIGNLTSTTSLPTKTLNGTNSLPITTPPPILPSGTTPKSSSATATASPAAQALPSGSTIPGGKADPG